jgi:hypothetical protein
VTDPAKELERRHKAGPRYLRHDGHPVMNWMASNAVVVRRRDETLLPIKENQDSPHKIDGIDAAINAIDPMIDRGSTDAMASVYDEIAKRKAAEAAARAAIAADAQALDEIPEAFAEEVPADGDERQAPAADAQAEDIDWAALNDVNHPMFAEMARRFEKRQREVFDEDF